MTRFRLAVVLVVLALVPIEAQSRNYYHRRQGVTSNTITLDFKKMADENPLSFGGLFIQGLLDGTNWQNTRVSGGHLFGTQSGTSGKYDDSITLIRGNWGTTVTITGTLRTTNQQTGGCYEELELLLYGDMTQGSMKMYENALRMTHLGEQYLGTTRWNGPMGVVNGCAAGCAYDSFDPGTIGPGVFDGDIITVSVAAGVITGKINGTTIWTHDTATDTPKYTSGLPGFGHWYHNTNGNSCGTGVPSDYWWEKITVTAS